MGSQNGGLGWLVLPGERIDETQLLSINREELAVLSHITLFNHHNIVVRSFSVKSKSATSYT